MVWRLLILSCFCFCLPVFILPARIVLFFEMIWCEAWNLVDARQKSPRTSELFSEPSLLTLRKSCSQHKPVREYFRPENPQSHSNQWISHSNVYATSGVNGAEITLSASGFVQVAWVIISSSSFNPLNHTCTFLLAFFCLFIL